MMVTGARCVCGEVMRGDKMFIVGVECANIKKFFEGTKCARYVVCNF